jgi:hypothetical protein
VVALTESLTVHEDNDVGVLLQRSRLAKVTQSWLLVGTLLRSAVELRQCDDRHLEFH